MKKLITILLILYSYFLYSQEDSCIICLSHSAGFYGSSFKLNIIPKDSLSYFYTTDGSTPTKSSNKYNNHIQIDSTTVVSIVAYKNDKPIDNKSFSFFVNRNFTMGVVSIIVNPNDFFGYSDGIYVKGCCADATSPYKGANFWKDWEKQINIEMFEVDGSIAFNQKAGARIFGGFSKGLPMKSLAVISRKKYEKKYFEYKLFKNKDINKFKSFVLRNSGGDFNKTHFRDALITDLVEPLDLEIQAYRPVVVYINGKYWGIHNLREKISEHYLKFNGGVDPYKVDLMKHRNDIQNGNREQYEKLIDFLYNNSLEDISNVRKLEKFMDINNYMEHNITQIFIDNRDAGGNIRYWKPQNDKSKWRWILFDTDLSLGISDWSGYKTNTLEKMTTKNNETWPNPPWSTFIIRQLLKNDSLKTRYITKFADMLNTVFSSDNVLFKIDSIKNLLNEEMVFHTNRWKSNDMQRWERNINIVKKFVTHRPHYVRNHLIEKFKLSDSIEIKINYKENNKGRIWLNNINIKKPFKGYYFKETPIKIVAKANLGYEFIEWKELKIKNNNYTLTPNKPIEITPIFKRKKTSKWQQKIVINEICLKSDTLNPTKDWIEIYNNSDTTIDISNWQIVIKNNFIKVSEKTNIPPKSYIVFARSPSRLQTIKNVSIDSLTRGIPAKKGFVAILDHDFAVVDSFKYNIKNNFKTYNVKLPIILEKVNPNNISNIANWNINNTPTIGNRNRAYKKPKIIEKSFLEKHKRYITLGSYSLIALLIIIFLIIRHLHFRKIG